MEMIFSMIGRFPFSSDLKPAVAVLFVPADHCEAMLKHNTVHNGLLRTMGFTASVVEPCTYRNGHAGHAEPTLYVFENVPQPFTVFVAKVDRDGNLVGGTRKGMEARKGEPCDIIPQVTGSISQKHIHKAASDFAFHPPPVQQAGSPRQKIAAR